MGDSTIVNGDKPASEFLSVSLLYVQAIETID